MSDFDNIMNDRLNDDDGEFFPRCEANWEKLSGRLAEFEAANPLPKATPSPILRTAWRRWAFTSAAAAALIGVSGLLMWHFNEVSSVQMENDRLQKEITALKSSQQSVNPNAQIETKSNIQIDVQAAVNQSEKTNNPNKLAETPITETNRVNSTPSPSNRDASTVSTPVLAQKQGVLNDNRQNTAVIDNVLNKNKKEIVRKETAKAAVSPKRNDSQLSAMDNRKVLNAILFDKKNESLNVQKKNLKDGLASQTDPSVKTDILEGNKGAFVENKQNSIDIAPQTVVDNIKTGTKELDTVETVAQNIPKQNDTPQTIAPTNIEKKEEVETAKTDIVVVEKTKEEAAKKTIDIAIEEVKPNAQTENVTPPIIPTDKNKRFQKFLPKGFAVGINGTYGSALPEIQGLKATTGMGASARLMLTRNIGLAVQGDLLETHFELRERPNHFHLPEAPDPKKPNVGLHHINGERKSRMLSVTAQYIFGQKWWIQPFVSVGHSWLKIDEHEVKFVFKDLTTGEETPSKATASTEKIKSLWQVGVGLEKKIKRWSFGVSAEMQKDFSHPTDPMNKTVASNFGILRGGVKFNIF
jgi:hypothetical protein